MTARPPIVTILGHVDHGKTTLLDTIRKSSVASREAGGITQSIGASKVMTSEGSITFIDTPGHAAFSQMRERGAKVADIAVLVVAADDGPMPQTREALSYLKQTKTPFIVALTKVDLPTANLEKAISELEKEGILFEGRGGDTPKIELSSKTGKGIDELLEMLFLVSGVSGVTGDKDGNLEAVVIETNKDKRGAVVSVVVKNGTLSSGKEIFADGITAKVRGLFDDDNKAAKSALPGDPSLILGFSQLPHVGSILVEHGNEQIVKEIPGDKAIVRKPGEEEVGIVLKAGSAGALEATIASLPGNAVVLDESIGEVTQSDVFFAKSVGAKIIVFQSKVPGSAAKLASTEGIEIHEFKIIYELLKYLEDELDQITIKIIGRAEVLGIFPYNGKNVAGCKVIEGKISMNARLELIRGDKKLGDVRIKSLKKGKQDAEDVLVGQECGILFAPQLDFQVGDVLLSAGN
jgi:translation initiation factor IF-2